MKKMLKAAALTAALALSAGAASAITVPIDGHLHVAVNGGFTDLVGAGQSKTFTFVADETLKVIGLTFLATGFNAGVDVANLSFGHTGNTGNTFATGEIFGSTGITSFADITMYAGDVLQFFVDNSNGAEFVWATATLQTAAVPVPAAGLLLLTALAGAGVVARRRKTT